MINLNRAKDLKKYAQKLGLQISLADAKRLSTAPRLEVLEFYMKQVEDILPRLRSDYNDLIKKYQELQK